MTVKSEYIYNQKARYPHQWCLPRGNISTMNNFLEKLKEYYPKGSFRSRKISDSFRIYFKEESSSVMFKLLFLDSYVVAERDIIFSKFISLRYHLKNFLSLTDEELKENERMFLEENKKEY